MLKNKSEELDKLLSLSNEMLEYAQQKNWDSIPELEIQRQTVMEAFFNEPVNETDSEQVANVIQTVLNINEHINQLATQAKQSIVQEAQGFKARQLVHSAYMQNK